MMTNDDFANRELSIEELEAIAGGWPHWLHSLVNWLESPPGSLTLNLVGVGLGVAGLLMGGGGSPNGGSTLKQN
jgi:hypothetical protein